MPFAIADAPHRSTASQRGKRFCCRNTVNLFICPRVASARSCCLSCRCVGERGSCTAVGKQNNSSRSCYILSPPRPSSPLTVHRPPPSPHLTVSSCKQLYSRAFVACSVYILSVLLHCIIYSGHYRPSTSARSRRHYTQLRL